MSSAEIGVTFTAAKSAGGSFAVMKTACIGMERVSSSSEETVNTENR